MKYITGPRNMSQNQLCLYTKFVWTIFLAVYKKGGFNITDIHCDDEFCKVIDPFLAKQDLKIKINYAAAQ